jgi:hypothetical protein
LFFKRGAIMKNLLKAVWFILSFSIPALTVYGATQSIARGVAEINFFNITLGIIVMFVMIKCSIRVYKSL